MNVSFAALQNHDGRYLLEDYAIHYAPAGAVLGFTAGMRRPDARIGAALLVADPTTVRRSPLDPQLPPLPGARLEVAQIAGLMPRNRVTVLEGGDASEPRVTSAASAKTIVHFATHAIVRDDAPNDSYLAFGPGGGSTTGVLTSRDIYDLRLDADLVVLSACRSGGGRVTGDGIATFARAFIYAGTPSLVVSLWDVADEPTSRLLPSFYRSWLTGASKARSLRRAQLQLLADLRAGNVRVETKAGPIVLPEHPVFWAGFVLIGEPD
jgi:CHAT domain-containing protein